MQIVIGYLYYDLLNLYGDIGNIKYLIYHLTNQNIKVKLKKLSIGDKIDFNSLDLIYLGAGTEENRDLVLEDLKTHQKELQKVCQNKFILVTGNSYPLFGKSIIDKDGKEKEALNIFPYHEIKTERIVNDVTIVSKDTTIYGFYNHFHDVINIDNTLFNKDGYHLNNFYGTYLLGPFLVRNPKFSIKFIKNLVKSKDPNFKFKKFDTSLDEKAYNNYIIFKQTKTKIK